MRDQDARLDGRRRLDLEAPDIVLTIRPEGPELRNGLLVRPELKRFLLCDVGSVPVAELGRWSRANFDQVAITRVDGCERVDVQRQLAKACKPSVCSLRDPAMLAQPFAAFDASPENQCRWVGPLRRTEPRSRSAGAGRMRSATHSVGWPEPFRNDQHLSFSFVCGKL